MFMRYACFTGNRGLLFEVGEAVEGLDLTSGMPGYQWQIVPNASSPPGFWSKEGLPFRYAVGKAEFLSDVSFFTGLGETRRQQAMRFPGGEIGTSTNSTTV